MREANTLPVLARLKAYRTAKPSDVRDSKYRNVPTVIDGIRFDSRMEAARYQELCLLQRSGAIQGLTVHERFELVPKATLKSGARVRAIVYEADFSYFEGITKVVEDVKGVLTPVFKLKANLFLRRYEDVDFRIVK